MRIILPLLAAFLTFSCKKEVLPEKETPVNKEVTFHIYAAKDYAGTTTENVNAELRLQLQIINYRTGAQQLVWDSILPVRRLTAFPLYDQKIVVKKEHPVLDSYQKLNGGFSVIYRDGPFINQAAKSDEAGPGTTAILLEANL